MTKRNRDLRKHRRWLKSPRSKWHRDMCKAFFENSHEPDDRYDALREYAIGKQENPIE